MLPNDRTGYQDTAIWNKLYNFQRDAATGIINKLETYNGCILADSVGLGKTFTALAVIKYYELRNRSVLVLCPKKLADNWTNYNANLTTNIFARDRFSYDVLCHTDLLARPRRVAWACRSTASTGATTTWSSSTNPTTSATTTLQGQRDPLPAADEPGHPPGRQDQGLDALGDPGQQPVQRSAEPTRSGLRGRVGESAGETEVTVEDMDEIFRRAQAAFNAWSKLPPEQRTPEAILDIAGLRLLRAARLRDHRALPQAHQDVLRHQGNRRVPRLGASPCRSIAR